MPDIYRRKTVTVSVGGVRVGSDSPVVVQSMTNTDTADVQGTIQQVAALAGAGIFGSGRVVGWLRGQSDNMGAVAGCFLQPVS